MRRRRNGNINKELIASIVIGVAMLAVLGFGVYAVSTIFEGATDNNNIVDLNETKAPEAPGQAFVAEDVTDAATSANNKQDTNYTTNIKDVAKEDETKLEKVDDNKENVTEKATSADSAVVNAPAVMDPMSAYTFSENSSLLWPVSGDIIMKYSMDSTILFKTLGMYKCNPAIMIKSDVGTPVGVAADGLVSQVVESEETGLTVSVAIGNDYVVSYGQLDDVVVKAGDKVTKGQLLGTVAEPSAYYVEEGSHLYFAATKAGAPVDPTPFFPSEE